MRALVVFLSVAPTFALAQETAPSETELLPEQAVSVDPGPEPSPAVANDAQPAVELGARIYTRYRLTGADPYHAFDLSRARLALDLHPMPWLRVQLDVDFAGATALKDAFIETAAHQGLSITAGQFKKPFSAVELISPGRLPLIRRGIVNERIVESGVDPGGVTGLGFGGRDRGVMAHGQIDKLRYALGAFNGTRSFNEVDSGKDAAARLELRGVKGVRLGASGSMHYRNPEGFEVPSPAVFAAGIDARLRLGALTGLAEVLWAQERSAGREEDVLGALVYLAAEIALTREWALEPMVKAEVLDDAVSRRGDLAWSFAGGANLHVAGALRLMLQGELTERQSGSPFARERAVTLQLAFDHAEPLARAGQVEP